MKKLLVVALIATSFVACNNGETKTEEKAADTTAVVAPAVDTTKAAPVVADTTKPAVADTTKK